MHLFERRREPAQTTCLQIVHSSRLFDGASALSHIRHAFKEHEDVPGLATMNEMMVVVGWFVLVALD